jgi:predicted alpha/beta superfamily hydrolase
MNRAVGFVAAAAASLMATCVVAQPADGPAALPIEATANASAGRLERFAPFPSRHVTPRTVDVWLPPNYSPTRRYAVLYVHDGQMLFDPATTWNKQAWDIDDVAARLIAAGHVREFIIVAPWNNGRMRHSEYFPQKFLAHLQPESTRRRFFKRGVLEAPASDAYLRFLVDELKPFIDARYATLPDRANTFLLGSSMGALISIYGLLEYPDTFGGVAALSTHWIGTARRNKPMPAAALAYLREQLPPPGTHRIYMDRGTRGLDAEYAEAQPLVDALLAERGFKAPDWVSQVFEGAGHTERDWNARLDIPLVFLLGTRATAP